MSQRRENRVAAVQFLYQWDANRPENLDQALFEFFTAYDYACDHDEPAELNPAPPEPPAPFDSSAPATFASSRPAHKQVTTLRKRAYFSFAEDLIRGTLEHLAEIDAVIQGYTQNWDFKRIARVDLAILRLALHEMLHRKDIPPIVSINEAIDLSKVFSIPDAKRFINGILDQFKAHLTRDLRKAER